MVNFGLMIFPTDKAIAPAELAVEAEARGFESLWFPEHSHIPASRETPWALRPDAPPLPEEYWRTHDQFVALAMAGAVTSKIKLATGISLVAQRDPIWLAKSVASLDALSDGRFIFGIGYGWNKEELAHHGVAFSQRRAVLRERVLAMKQIWTQHEAEFQGEHVQFGPSWSWPKPTQRPHPPIILGGGAGPRTIAHIIEFCDGFMPISGRYDFGDQVTAVRLACEQAGRDPQTLEFGQFATPPEAEVIESLIELGISRIVFGLPPKGRDEVLTVLDSLVDVASRFAP